MVESFDDLEYGERIVYVGPDRQDLPDGWAAPAPYKQPYIFQYVSVCGVVNYLTCHKGKRRHLPEHPANNPDYWRRVEGEEVDAR